MLATGHPAVVLGDLDVVRPLLAAGVRCAVFTTPSDSARASRLVDEKLPWIDHRAHPEAVVDLLLEYAARQPLPPVLFPQSDADLLLISRHRDALAERCLFTMADAELVEMLLDKDRFRALAVELDLPVPRSEVMRGGVAGAGVELRPPVLIKPLTWTPAWRKVTPRGKALLVDSEVALAGARERLAAAGLDALAQEYVPGPESRIESYHVYVDAAGAVAGEFTGCKIRTWPVVHGDSCAVEVTLTPDVLDVGRDVVERLGLHGMAKLDFKRGPDGTLHLLEVNPRTNLWHHPGAIAGVNLPALVYADLTGGERPPAGPVRPGVRWCQPIRDFAAARASGVGTREWLRFLRSCEARGDMALDDPLPALFRIYGNARARL